MFPFCHKDVELMVGEKRRVEREGEEELKEKKGQKEEARVLP